MRFPFYLRFVLSRVRALCCIVALASSLHAQSPNPTAILELRACGHLQVFEDGKVLESRHGKTIERRLSESRMRRLRQVFARFPCVEQWKARPATQPTLTDIQSATIHQESDCDLEHLGYGGGLIEAQLNIHYRELQTGPFPIYMVCEHAKQSEKDQAKLNYKRVLKRTMQRFLKDVVAAADSKSILTDCDCRN